MARNIFAFPENRNPTTYYGRRSGVGLALRFCCDGPKRVGVIGLGAQERSRHTEKPATHSGFYEINPQVIQVAESWFTFLKSQAATTEIILENARVSLESAEDTKIPAFDMLTTPTKLQQRGARPARRRPSTQLMPLSNVGSSLSVQTR